MTREEIFQKVKATLNEEFEIEPEKITPEAKLADDLELDSIDAVDLLIKMKEYIPGKKIDPEQFKKVVVVRDVVELIYPLLQDS